MFEKLRNFVVSKLSNFMWKDIHTNIENKEFLEKEIVKWKNSPQRIMQIKAFRYYDNEHDILKRRRTMIGTDGKLEVVENLPNNKVIDNQYAKMVNQKANYLFGQPVTWECDNEQYAELLKTVFNKRFMKTLKSSGKAAYNGGICWLYPYYTERGEFSFRLFPAYEILPFWKDSEHTILDFAIRDYLVPCYEGGRKSIVEKVEIYDLNGVHKCILKNGVLIPDNSESETDCCHVVATNLNGKVTGFNWERIPLIPLKANENETSLLKNVKSLQDGINILLSDFENNMQEDARNTILVLKNYDGQNLGEFRKNLATYGAVKVRYDGDTKGGVETLEIKVNAENYKTILEIFKKALIENAMGYDAKDERMSGTPNQMNIQSMYSDIDLAANDTETEYQAAFEELLWFVNAHFANIGKGDFSNEKVNIIFNRDMMMNESEIIANCQASMNLLSEETIIAQHPWIDDPKLEMERLEQQKQKAQEELERQYNPFGQMQKRSQPEQINGKGSQGGGVIEE